MLQCASQIRVGVFFVAACIDDDNTPAPSTQHLVQPKVIEMTAVGQIDELAIIVRLAGELLQHHWQSL